MLNTTIHIIRMKLSSAYIPSLFRGLFSSTELNRNSNGKFSPIDYFILPQITQIYTDYFQSLSCSEANNLYPCPSVRQKKIREIRDITLFFTLLQVCKADHSKSKLILRFKIFSLFQTK